MVCQHRDYTSAGVPKMGKSWLALWLCTRITSGRHVWKFAVRPSAQQRTVRPPEGLVPKQREKWLNEQAVLFDGFLLYLGGYKLVDLRPEDFRYSGKKKEKLVADEETIQKIITTLENESLKYETYYKLIIATGMSTVNVVA
jgi:hypothetical protein